MIYQQNPYLVLQLASAVVTFGLGIYILTRSIKKQEYASFSLLMFGGALWATSGAIAWISPDPTWQTQWNKVTYLGVMLVPTAWLMFAVMFSGVGRRLLKKRGYLLWIVPGLLYLTTLTNEWHGLFFAASEFVSVDGFVLLRNQPGPVFAFHTVYSYVLLLTGLFMMGVAILRRNLGWRGPSIIVGILAPFVGNILYTAGALPNTFPDPTPMLFTLTGAAFAWAIFVDGILVTVPMAHKTIVRSLLDGIIVLDNDNHILDLNPTAEKILHGSPAMRGQPLAAVLNGGTFNIAPLMEALATIIEEPTEAAVTAKVATDEGVVAYRVFISPIQNGWGHITGRMLQFKDISPVRRAELSLEQTTRSYLAVMDTLQDGYFEADRFGILTYANESLIHALGCTSKDQVIGKHFRRFTSREYVRTVSTEFGKIYQTKQPIEPFLCGYRRADGSILASQIAASPIIVGNEVVGTRGTIHDITERVEREKALRAAKEDAEARAEELATINRVAETVNRSLDLPKVLQSICVELTKTFDIRNAGIGLLDEAGENLEIVAFHTTDPEEQDATDILLPIRDNLATQWVIETKQSLAVNDVQNDPRTASYHALSSKRGTRSIMIVPLLARGKAIGTIGMPAKDPDYHFTDKEVALAETLASQIGFAVDNARLHAQTENALDVAETELEIGQKIQSGFFPAELPHIPGWEVASVFEAARQVSGDFYDAFRLGDTDQYVVVIADVCDKGVGAALFMVTLRSLIRSISERECGRPAHELLHSVATQLNRYIVNNHDSSNMFATAFLAVLHADEDTLHYVNGGHEEPFLLDAEGNLLERLSATGPAFGFSTELDFEVKSVTFAPEHLLIAFTDGITEAKNPSEDFYGDDRLAERVTQQWPSALSAAKQVEADVFAHIEDHQQTDDVTLIALRRRVESQVERHTLVQEATLRNLPRLRQFAAESAQRLGASDALASVLKLIVDEIGTNVINYGYEGDATGEIRLKIWENGRDFTIQFEDEGQPFNPLTHPKPELEDDLDTRQTGGLGLYFVRELSDRLIYETDGIINRLTLQVGSDYLG